MIAANTIYTDDTMQISIAEYFDDIMFFEHFYSVTLTKEEWNELLYIILADLEKHNYDISKPDVLAPANIPILRNGDIIKLTKPFHIFSIALQIIDNLENTITEEQLRKLNKAYKCINFDFHWTSFENDKNGASGYFAAIDGREYRILPYKLRARNSEKIYFDEEDFEDE